jgi:hypothetical protein
LSTAARPRPITDAEFAALTQDQLEQLGLAEPRQGAPLDFGGRVLPNPNGIVVSDDTDSGIPATRLPNGVTFQKQNFTGAATPDVSNPDATQVIPPALETVAATKTGTPVKVDYDALAKKHGAASAAAPVDYDALAQKHGATDRSSGDATSKKDDRGWLDREIPLDSYAHATESGLQ